MGQQVCDPPSDCDLNIEELLDVFATTPIIEDIEFSPTPPYPEEQFRYLAHAARKVEMDRSEL